MRWSQLKVRAESLLADSLRGRVHYYCTRYRHDHDREGRSWITVDAVQVADMSTLRAWADQHRRAIAAMGYAPSPSWHHWPEMNQIEPVQYWERWREAEAERMAAGVFARWDFTGALWEYQQMSLESALGSENVLIRAIAYLDRRLGKRRFQRLRPAPADHPLVWAMFNLRAEAEGWGTEDAADA